MNALLNEGPIVKNKDTGIDHLCNFIARKDFCHIPAEKMLRYILDDSPQALDDLQAFKNSWNDLAQDEYMADGGKYRLRRHATLSALPSSRIVYIQPHQPHQPHYQSLTYNHLNGNIARHYQPIAPHILAGSTMTALIRLCCGIFGRLSPYSEWHIEAHQFRIDATILAEGNPTPEGIHRDGVSFVLMMMVKRTNVVNGCTQIYDLEKRRLDSFTLTDTFDSAIVNDLHVMHSVTPIVRLDQGKTATRDMLVLTFHKK